MVKMLHQYPAKEHVSVPDSCSVCLCLYLGLGTSVVFLLGQVLSALGLRTGYVVSNSHWKHQNMLARATHYTFTCFQMFCHFFDKI